MYQLKILKRPFFYLFLALATTLVACDDDDPIEPEEEEEETEVIDPNAYHISFKLDGEPYSLVPNGVNVADFITRSGNINVFEDPENEGEIECGGGFETASEYLEISYKWAYVVGDYADDYDAALVEALAAGTYAAKLGDETGFELQYSNSGTGESYRSSTGDQTGSSFVISEIISTSEYLTGDITIKGSFNCKLYDEGLTAHNVTEGSYYVRFESR